MAGKGLGGKPAQTGGWGPDGRPQDGERRLAGCGARWGAVDGRGRCRRGTVGGHSQTFRHRRGGLGISDGVGECSILQTWRDSATMSQHS